MADVPLAVAIISTISPVVAGALPLVVGWIRDTGREKRELAERVSGEQLRLEQSKLGECATLLRLARNYRVVVENACDSQGADLVGFAQQIRQLTADITGQADEVGLMVPATESAASQLAQEARSVCERVTDKGNRVRGETLTQPSFTSFDKYLEEFKAAAQAAFNRSSPVHGQLPG
jgi:hypothetical protein